MSSSSGSNLSQLLSVVDGGLHSATKIKGEPGERQLKVTLDDTELWKHFESLTNEMIVTKNGRRMFPVVKVNVAGLDPSAMYTVLLEFVQIDGHRWKYVNGEWVPGGKAEPPPHHSIYMHPESPNFGAHWMREPVSFAKVKLTNKSNGGGQIILNSLHKYEPRIHIVKVGTPPENRTVSTHAFPETRFIAVTAYQNEEVTSLKIKHNPFAKAFLDAKERPDTSSSESPQATQQPQYAQFGPWYIPPNGMCPPPGHPLGLTSGPTHCSSDRSYNLKAQRHSPYSQPYHPHHRRSPTYGGYSYDTSPQPQGHGHGQTVFFGGMGASEACWDQPSSPPSSTSTSACAATNNASCGAASLMSQQGQYAAAMHGMWAETRLSPMSPSQELLHHGPTHPYAHHSPSPSPATLRSSPSSPANALHHGHPPTSSPTTPSSSGGLSLSLSLPLPPPPPPPQLINVTYTQQGGGVSQGGTAGSPAGSLPDTAHYDTSESAEVLSEYESSPNRSGSWSPLTPPPTCLQ